MIIGKRTCIVGVSAVLVAIAAPPNLRTSTKKIAVQLRSGSKIAALLAQHGLPYHVYHTGFRLVSLSNVNPDTCVENPTGRNACYLVESDQKDANLDAFDAGYESWQKTHLEEWALLLENDDGIVDFQSVLRDVGHDASSLLSSLTQDELNAAYGAADRSLKEEPLHHSEIRPGFDMTDTNNDGLVSWEEKGALQQRECEARTGNQTVSCGFYVQLTQLFEPNSTMTFDDYVESIVTEGASVREEVSRNFAFFSSF